MVCGDHCTTICQVLGENATKYEVRVGIRVIVVIIRFLLFFLFDDGNKKSSASSSVATGFQRGIVHRRRENSKIAEDKSPNLVFGHILKNP
jgi:hypothetical protein